jgi:very-short-patch-repair endonuclease
MPLRKVDYPSLLAEQVRYLGLAAPVREYRFHTSRLWRFDLAWPARKFAVEVDGGGFVAGRHGRGAGIEKDCEKFAEAICDGWTVLRVTPGHIAKGLALGWVERCLLERKGTP